MQVGVVEQSANVADVTAGGDLVLVDVIIVVEILENIIDNVVYSSEVGLINRIDY